tara:strand:+ start:6645 stop:7865 length:1221 start_codon:yes stop_codon:yes gene_type:complete
MKLLLSDKFINIIFRAATILLKFLLSIIIIKKISIEEYGVYGVFQSTVIIMSFVLGIDFYAYSSREILKKNAHNFNFYFSNQLLLHAFSYIIILPLTYLIFYLGILDKKYLILFYLILVTEHLSQELYRMLIILKKSVTATIILFVRSGLWVIILYFVWEEGIMSPTLNSLLILWLSAALLSIIIGFAKIKFKWESEYDFSWIVKGVRIAFPFFIGTVLYKLIEFSGRYFLNYYWTSVEVGIFTFFSSVASILFVFVQTIVIIVIYPELLESKNKGHDSFLKKFKYFKNQILTFTTLGTVLSLIFIYPLLLFLDNSLFFENLLSYIILLISSFIFCFSFIPHYALYTYKFDSGILFAVILGTITNFMFSFIFVPLYGLLGASVSQLTAFIVIYIVKLILWKKKKPF